MKELSSSEIDTIQSALYHYLCQHERLFQNGNLDEELYNQERKDITNICKKLNINDAVYNFDEEEAEAYLDHLTYQAECRDHNL